MRLRDGILVLRYASLSRIPVAVAQTEILRERGLRPWVVEFGCDDEGFRRHDRIPFLRLRGARGPRPLRAFLGWARALGVLIALCRRARPRLLLAHGLQEQALALCLKRLLGVRYVVDVHEIYDRNEIRGTNRFFFRLEPAALNAAEMLIFPEADRSELYARRYRLRPRRVTVYNCPRRGALRAASGGLLRRALGVAEDKHVLLYCGGIGPHNCLEESVGALALWDRLVLVCVGWSQPGWLARLAGTADRLGVADRFLALGPTREWRRYYGAADVALCLYSPGPARLAHAATASHKLMEAIAAGLPVISSHYGGFEAIVAGHDLGRCLREPSAGTIARAARELVRLPRSAHPRRRARRLHLSELNYEHQFAKALPIIEHLVGLPRK